MRLADSPAESSRSTGQRGADLSTSFLAGGGEMGRLMRAHDWSASPLGEPETWPQSLRSVVQLMLNNRQLMFVAWGPELTFLYNDGYVPTFGAKHPGALGRPFREVWSEIWDDIEPLVTKALAGETTYNENLHLVVERNGYPEDAWFTFSYSPVRDESGVVAGMFCAGIETTAQVLAERRQAFRLALEEHLRNRDHPREVVGAAVETLGRHLRVSRVGYGEVQADGETIAFETDYADGVAHLVGTFPTDNFGPGNFVDLRRGLTTTYPDLEADPRTAGVGFPAIEARAAMAVPLVREGRLRAVLYLNHREVREWTPDEVALVEEVAARTWDALERARAEAEARRSEARAGGVLQGMAEGFVLLDRDFRVVDINAEGLRIDGCPREAIVGKSHWEAWPGTEDSAQGRLYKQAMAERVPVSVEICHVWEDGHDAWVDIRAYPADDGLAIFYRDVSDRKRAEADLRESEALRRQILNSATDYAIVATDREGKVTSWSEGARRVLGWTEDEMVGHTAERFFTPEDVAGGLIQAEMRSALEEGVGVGEGWRVRKGGERFWANGEMKPLRDDAGTVVGFVRVLHDRTEQRRAEEHRELLINELNHRVKNTLATVQSIASQSFGRAAVTTAEQRRGFEERLFALARAHDVLTRENWAGANLHDIVGEAIAPYRGGGGRADRFEVEGPLLRVPPRAALALAMALQELSTNAAKYGALSASSGQVSVLWAVAGQAGDRRLILRWQEQGGPAVSMPTRKGFGTRLIERGLAAELGGEVRLAYPVEGVVCAVDAPLPDGEAQP